jgi:hypothetical protein
VVDCTEGPHPKGSATSSAVKALQPAVTLPVVTRKRPSDDTKQAFLNQSNSGILMHQNTPKTGDK